MATGVTTVFVVESDLETADGARGRSFAVAPDDTETIGAYVRSIDISWGVEGSCG